MQKAELAGCERTTVTQHLPGDDKHHPALRCGVLKKFRLIIMLNDKLKIF